jgi:hypothetical protein
MNVNDGEVRFQLDSAADVKTICKKCVRPDQARPTSNTRRMWNKTPIIPLGEADLTVKNPSTGDETIVTMIAVSNGHVNLLGMKSVQKIYLITMNNDCFIAIKIGDLGADEIKSKTLPCRKLPLSLRDHVKREIDKLVLLLDTELTEWVNQLF